MTQGEQIASIVASVARIEGAIEEGVIKRLDKLNGTQDRQWTKINRNAVDIVEQKTRLESHCGNPGLHENPDDEESGGVQAARIRASSARVVAVIVCVTSVVTSVLTAGATLLVSYLF